MSEKPTYQELEKKIKKLEKNARNVPTAKNLMDSQAIYENIQVGLHIYHLKNLQDDTTLTMLSTNQAASRFTGIPAEDVIGKTLDENFPGLRDKGIPQIYAEVVRSGKTKELEDVYYGDDRVVESAFSVVAFSLPNNCVGVSFENITERRNAEDALKESEERFRTMADLLPGAVVETDADLNIKYVNKYGLKLFGYSEDDIKNGINGTELIHHDYRKKAQSRVAQHFVKKDLLATEYKFLKKNNESIYVLLNATPIFRKKEVVGFRSVIIDISKRKEIEKDREKLISKLKNALGEIKELRGFFPICCCCKKIRDDEGFWQRIDKYIQDRTDAQFSHGLCPDCAKELYPELDIHDD